MSKRSHRKRSYVLDDQTVEVLDAFFLSQTFDTTVLNTSYYMPDTIHYGTYSALGAFFISLLGPTKKIFCESSIFSSRFSKSPFSWRWPNAPESTSSPPFSSFIAAHSSEHADEQYSPEPGASFRHSLSQLLKHAPGSANAAGVKLGESINTLAKAVEVRMEIARSLLEVFDFTSTAVFCVAATATRARLGVDAARGQRTAI